MSFTPQTPLANGGHTFTLAPPIRRVQQRGVQRILATIDATPPAAPVIASVADNIMPDGHRPQRRLDERNPTNTLGYR